jgi:hypothetical protein
MLSHQEEQIERRRVLDNDRRLREQDGSAYIDHYMQEAGGRFAAHAAATVVGQTAVPNYPAAAHQRDPVPLENPFGYRIDAMPELETSTVVSTCPVEARGPAYAPSTLDAQRAGPSLSYRRLK